MKIDQMEMVSVEQLVPKGHTYRKLKQLLNFDRIANFMRDTFPHHDE